MAEGDPAGKRMKGITPIISTIVLLLITVALAGAAWAYISGFFGAYTKVVDIPPGSTYFDGSNVNIMVRNIGTSAINTSSCTASGNAVTCGDLTLTREGGGAPNITLSSGGIEPGKAIMLKDTDCQAGNVKYTLTSPSSVYHFDVYSGSGCAGTDVAGVCGFADTLYLADGNVGIGTTGPNRPLHVASATSGITIQGTAGFGTLDFESSNGVSGNLLGVIRSMSKAVSGDDAAQIRFELDGAAGASNNPTALVFKTGTSGGGTERIRIQSDGDIEIMNGNLGIGTTGPGKKLDVIGQARLNSTSPELDFYKSNAAADMKLWRIEGDTQGIWNFLSVNDAATDSRVVMQVERSAWDSITDVSFPTGNVGIGTTGPANKLHVIAGAANEGYNLGISAPASIATWRIVNPTVINTVQFGTVIGNQLDFLTDGAVRVTIRETTGNVGIGTTGPTAKLDVNGATGYNQLRLRVPFTPTGTADVNGNVGDVSWDSNYIYVKTASGWKRAALTAF